MFLKKKVNHFPHIQAYRKSIKSLVSPVISVTIHSDIQRFDRSPTAEHFCLQGHDFLSHASVCCLESNSEWEDNARKSRESYWIRRLNTLNPSGINKGD